MFDYELFVNKFLDNQLEQIKDIDQLLNIDDINNILQLIKDKQQNDFILEEIIQKIIIDSSNYLPQISLNFSRYYFFNQKITVQSYINIYKNFKINKCILNNLLYAIVGFQLNISNYNGVFNLKQLIKRQEYICEYENLQFNNINKIYYQIVQFHITDWKKIFLFIYIVYKNLTVFDQQHFVCYNELLLTLYKYYIANQFTYQEKKQILNILIYIFIYSIQNNIKYNFKAQLLQQLYSQGHIRIFDMIISNWNMIKNKYKLILCQNSREWIKFLRKNGFIISKEDHIDSINYLKIIELYKTM